MLVTALLIVVVAVLATAFVVMWRLARRTEDVMDFEQAEGMAKADDGLRLGIALSANAGANAGF